MYQACNHQIADAALAAGKSSIRAGSGPVKWDTERSPKGAPLDHYSIQVGLSRHVIRAYVDDWIVAIEDITPTVARLYKLVHTGRVKEANRLMPTERVYPVPSEVGHKLLI